ncbi:MAG: glycoside hydrolase family 127 protein [Clostridia bacterium]|nr:glycoside hydrolase family 127 protein [Clostridia bacterium]
MIKKLYEYLPNGAAKYKDIAHENALFILQKQLKDKTLWRKFVNVFYEKADIVDNGWRGEYFGKMMRGACLTYRYLPDEELYDVLCQTVYDLLQTQDEEGRITTYTKEAEFNGWDMWTRKYVLVGCLYFYEICKDESFKTEILNALQRHVDYLIQKIGQGKISILDTSHWYGGLNSSSILEPIVELYRLTRKDKYLTFAKYILDMGGCKGGNLLELAEEGSLMPYQYPEVKAYETMSYFEGALAYYEVTGDERYLHIVEKFVDAVRKSDITIIGCAGCTHELFDNSAQKQTEGTADKAIMQETCVTVTWMRLQERLLRLTGEEKYANEIERSAYNALYGSINIYGNKQYCAEEQELVEGVPFDSYSPLVNQPRGIGIGGYKKFAEGGYYGCCACIGAAGTGLFPLIGVMQTRDGVVFNDYHKGVVDYITPMGNKVEFHINGDYIGQGEVIIKLSTSIPEKFSLDVRIPLWSKQPQVQVNNTIYKTEQGYCKLEREWKNGDVIYLAFHPELRKVDLNGKSAFIYGNVVLARDEQKENADITGAFVPSMEDRKPIAQKVKPEQGEEIRFLLNTDVGTVLLTDYASCGKKWLEENARISVWFKHK